MGKLILVNDVQTDMGQSGLIVGSHDASVSADGNVQAEKLAKHICQHIGRINLIASSDAPSCKKILSRIRSCADDLSQQKIRETKLLRERDFGVLTCSKFSLSSDIFRHTRICAENGESVSQCFKRTVSYVESLCRLNIHRIVVLSHPFVCQILTNAFLKNEITHLSEFWFKKTSFIEFDFAVQTSGISWIFKNAHNVLEGKKYSKTDIGVAIP